MGSPAAIAFLTLDEVLAIHAHQIDRYGGAHGIRDAGRLESALAMPDATFSGERVHPTLFEQGAAYLFHLVKNHPFVDGNKRIGLATCLVFQRLNEISISATDDELVELTIGVATGTHTKADIAVFLTNHHKPRVPKPR